MRSIFVLLPLIFLTGCIEFEPFIDIKESPYGTRLKTVNLLSSNDKASITTYIESNTYFDACIALKSDELFYNYGDTNIPYNCASVRKSIFSALYGIAIEKGIIDIDQTLGELGIDDNRNPLTQTEKSATVKHLLQARSGIYLPAIGESDGMIKRKPPRGTYLPGEHFYYNNWDFNALPIILERKTGKSIGDLIYEWLAIPTGMRHFVPENVTYQYENYTEYPQTRVYITAEDLARIGSLYLNNGKWGTKQVIPEDWVTSSVIATSHEPEDADLLENELMEGYAYLWWLDDDENTFWADGAGGHFLIVDRSNNIVVVVRNNTGMSGAGYTMYNATNRYESNTKGNEVYKTIRSKIVNE